MPKLVASAKDAVDSGFPLRLLLLSLLLQSAVVVAVAASFELSLLHVSSVLLSVAAMRRVTSVRLPTAVMMNADCAFPFVMACWAASKRAGTRSEFGGIRTACDCVAPEHTTIGCGGGDLVDIFLVLYEISSQIQSTVCALCCSSNTGFRMPVNPGVHVPVRYVASGLRSSFLVMNGCRHDSRLIAIIFAGNTILVETTYLFGYTYQLASSGVRSGARQIV